jgi:hypothetical protein
MKLSNFALSIVASGILGLAVSMSTLVMSNQSTVVISMPSEDGIPGGGFSMNLPKNLSSKQVELLSMAYDIAKHDGHKYPQILQGILLQESEAGSLASYKVAGQEFGLKTNERYYGVTQLKLAAARDVLNKYPNIKSEFKFQSNTDEEVIAKLIENDKFNLSVASKYLMVLKAAGYNTISQLALAYNQGAEGAKNKDPETNHYSRGVLNHISNLKLKT